MDFDKSVVFQPIMNENQRKSYNRILSSPSEERDISQLRSNPMVSKLKNGTYPEYPGSQNRPPWRFGGSSEEGLLDLFNFEKENGTWGDQNKVVINGSMYEEMIIPITKTTPLPEIFNDTPYHAKVGGTTPQNSKSNILVASILLCMTVVVGVVGAGAQVIYSETFTRMKAM